VLNTLNKEDWLSVLRANGSRVTAARCAVVETMIESTHALTPVEVYDAARSHYPNLGLVSVYRTLEKLEALGLVQRVHHSKDCQAFLVAGQGHQHLILCSHCGKAVLFEGDDLAVLFATVARQTGFEIKEHWLQLYGLCADCK
jgi:Fur family transcriptional regulator, ferric uptake regulator